MKPTVHTNPSRNQSFSKKRLKQDEVENARLSFTCGPNTFQLKTGLFVNDDVTIITDVVFLTEFSANTNPK